MTSGHPYYSYSTWGFAASAQSPCNQNADAPGFPYRADTDFEGTSDFEASTGIGSPSMFNMGICGSPVLYCNANIGDDNWSCKNTDNIVVAVCSPYDSGTTAADAACEPPALGVGSQLFIKYLCASDTIKCT